jgi:hypothetical protein
MVVGLLVYLYLRLKKKKPAEEWEIKPLKQKNKALLLL